MVEKRELVVQNQQEKRQKQLSQTKQEVYRPITRVSDLEAPIMQLSGHKAEVLTVQFSPDNQIIASAGFDKQILLWNLKCENYGLINTLGPVLQLKFSRDSKQLYGCSSDYTCSIYDLERGEIMKRFRGHKQIVNSIALNRRGQELLVSVSDDGSTKVWDQRQSHSIKSYESNSPLTACEFERDGTIVYSAGIDSKIRGWDLRNDKVLHEFKHDDTITGLKVSNSGNHLVSNAMDNTCKIWDIRPFTEQRLVKVLHGAPHGFEKNLLRPCWSPEDDFVAVGSGDRSVVVWDVDTGDVVYKLPGHQGCVNEVDWAKNVIVSCSNDRTLFVGELNTSELQ